MNEKKFLQQVYTSLNRLNIICIEVCYTKGFSNFVFEHIVKVIRR